MTEDLLVVRAVHAWVAALLARDWETMTASLTDDHRMEDRRIGFNSVLDKEGSVLQAQVIAQLAEDQPNWVDVEIIETRGEHHALLRQTYRTESIEVAVLAVMKVDGTGRTSDFIAFDDDAIDAARAELETLSQR